MSFNIQQFSAPARVGRQARKARGIAITILALCVAGLPATRHAHAQTGSLRVSLPSPTAASLGKFGDVPVSLYTGAPEISVPLFTAQGRTLELPIALRYHAAGIRVQEIGGWAGIGWALEAGGTITRTVRGLVDESINGYYNTGYRFWQTGSWPTPTSTIIDDIANEVLDGEPDRFFFSFAGRSGQFAMGPSSTSTTIKDYRAIPYQKLQIQPSFSGNGITSWTITTEDGTRYTFAAAETNTDFNVTSPGNQIPAHYGESYTSAWQLTEIRSVGGDVITLHYSPYTATHRLATSREKFDQVVSSPGSPACVPPQSDVTNEYEVAVQRLDSIKTAAHTIKFAPGTTLRTDALSPAGAPQEPRLATITATTPTGTVLRVFQLEHDYSTGRLTLRNVYEQDRNGVSLPPYTFVYGGPALPALTTNALDHWGYYNGKTSNSTPIPAAIAPNGTVLTGADRSPDVTYMKAGSLTRITYPTGGYNEFVYDANDYGAIGQNGAAPKDKVRQRTATARSDAYQGPRSTTFTVGGTDRVTATIDVTLDPACGTRVGCPYATLSGIQTWTTSGRYYKSLTPGTTYTATASEEESGGLAIIEISWPEIEPVKKKTGGALRIAELRTADAMGNIAVRKYRYRLQSDTARSSGVVNVEPDYDYSYSSPSCSYFSRSSMSKMPLGEGPAVGYSEVTVWLGANGENGKSRHAFRSVLDNQDDPPPNSVWPFSTRTSREWKRGQQLGATDYNASGQTQRRTASTFAFASDTATTRNFRGISINAFSAGQLGSTYVYNPFEVLSGWAYQDSDTTVTYDDSGSSSFSTARTYTYGNPRHIQLTERTETNSDGTQRVTRLKYPADYATGSGNPEAAALAAMQGAAQIHSAAIERTVVKKVGAVETVEDAELTTFKEFAAGQFLPFQRFVLNSASGLADFIPSAVTGGVFAKDSRYLVQETANGYDPNGRLIQLADARGKLTNFEYGGNANAAFLTRVTRARDGAGLIDLVTDVGYDTDGFVSSIKDEGGTFRYFTYDLYGRLRQLKNHDGTAVKAYGYTYSRTSPSWTFNASTPNAVIDTTFLQQTPTPTSVVSTGYVDGLGKPIQSVVQDGTAYMVTATQYDVMGRPWRIWKPYSRTIAGYDASFATNATSFYNSYHAATDAKPYAETQYTTDALARVKKVTPEYVGISPTAFTQYTYAVDVTPKQQFTEVTDESGKKTRRFADLFGNDVKIVLGYGAAEATTTSLSYDIRGQQTQTVDPRNLSTTYSLSTRGLLATKTSPDGGTASFKYDVAGNARFSQDANQAGLGQVYFTTYDFANRPLTAGLGAATFATLDPDAANPPALETTQANWLAVRQYDAKPTTTAFPWNLFSPEIAPLTLANVSGRLAATASKSNNAWQVTLFSYDTDGRVATRFTYTQANNGTSVLTALNTTVGYVRDLRDALTERRLTVGANTFNHWYDYDGRGLLRQVFASTGSTKPAAADVAYSYRPGGQLQDRQFLGGPLVPVRYTIREQLETIGDPAGAAYPFSARYSYQPNGAVSEAEFYSAGSPAAQKRYKYAFPTYDALNRLKSADFSSWSGTAWTATPAYGLAGITYDASGNLTALQRYRESGTLIDNLAYAYPSSSNRLASVSDAAGVTAESWDAESGSFTHDANGNLLTAPSPYAIGAVTYDHRNLPVALTSNGVSTAYRYDEEGQRIAKQVGSGSTEVYLLDGASTLGVFTVDGAGTPTSWSFNVLAGDKVVGRQPGTGSRSHYHSDLLGSTRAVAQGASVVESVDYDPWGLLLAGRTLGGGTKEGFTGKERDAESGMDYFGARLYMPALARWAAVDPLAEKHVEWSPYNYVLDNPLALVDPDGRQVQANTRGSLAPGGMFVRGPVRPGAFAGAAAIGLATAVDRVAGFVPGASTVQDATAVAFGTSLSGEQLSSGDRALALVGLLTPVSGKELGLARAGLEAAGDGLRAGGKFGGDAAQSAVRSERRFPTRAQRDRVFERTRDANGTPRCEYCGTELARAAGKPNSYQADHVQPYSRGGPTTDENLVGSCAACNNSKGNKILNKEWTPPKERPQE